MKTALLLSKHVSAFDVNATTNRGEVTLTGEVPSEETRRLAAAITQDTSGVSAVHNNLTVNPAARGNQDVAQLGDRVADLEIKTLVIDQLARSPELKDKTLKVQVSKRVVEPGRRGGYARAEASRGADRAPGARRAGPDRPDHGGQCGTAPESADDKLARRVEFELYSTRALPLQSVQVRSQDGTVFLTGPVTSRAEKLLAERVSQSVDGVKRVVNNLSAPEGARRGNAPLSPLPSGERGRVRGLPLSLVPGVVRVL